MVPLHFPKKLTTPMKLKFPKLPISRSSAVYRSRACEGARYCIFIVLRKCAEHVNLFGKFKNFMLLQALFHKQHSDESELSARQNKVKLSNIVVECRKEGSVQYLTPESLEHPSGPQKWEKCRLALVKTVGGYMLEFYSPPKSTQVDAFL